MIEKDKWYFTKERLMSTPSFSLGYDADSELSSRQEAADLIQDMGQRLRVTMLCINTAVVYMHRFYVFHSFSVFHRNLVASTALFLAAKVEEQPKKIHCVLKASRACSQKDIENFNTQSPQFLEEVEELLLLEQIMLETLGFEVRINHPHPFVVKISDAVQASQDLSRVAYLITSYCWQLTTMCLQYPPSLVAAVCFHLAYQWLCTDEPVGKNGKKWYNILDDNVSLDLIKELGLEFLKIIKKCPANFKDKTLALNSLKISLVSFSENLLSKFLKLSDLNSIENINIKHLGERNAKFMKSSNKERTSENSSSILSLSNNENNWNDLSLNNRSLNETSNLMNTSPLGSYNNMNEQFSAHTEQQNLNVICFDKMDDCPKTTAADGSYHQYLRRNQFESSKGIKDSQQQNHFNYHNFEKKKTFDNFNFDLNGKYYKLVSTNHPQVEESREAKILHRTIPRPIDTDSNSTCAFDKKTDHQNSNQYFVYNRSLNKAVHLSSHKSDNLSCQNFFLNDKDESSVYSQDNLTIVNDDKKTKNRYTKILAKEDNKPQVGLSTTRVSFNPDNVYQSTKTETVTKYGPPSDTFNFLNKNIDKVLESNCPFTSKTDFSFRQVNSNHKSKLEDMMEIERKSFITGHFSQSFAGTKRTMTSDYFLSSNSTLDHMNYVTVHPYINGGEQPEGRFTVERSPFQDAKRFKMS